MASATEAPVIPSKGDRLKVLWLIKGLDQGGAEELLLLMARNADRQRFEYEAAYLLPYRSALAADLRSASVTVHCLDAGKEWNLGWMRRLRRLLVERRYDLVHVHSPYVAGFARFVVKSLPRSHRPALITTEHLPWAGYVLATRVLNALTYRLDDAHIAVSNSVRDSIPVRMNGDIRVIRNGIDLERVRGHLPRRVQARADLGIGPDEFLVGTVANFRPQKRYPDLLMAARRLIDMRVNVRFVAVGHGPLEHELIRLRSRLGIEDRFRFLGRLDEPASVMAACDAFALASEFEGLPLAVMEALALGLPIVATRISGIAECVRHAQEALLVPVGRPDLLAGALHTLGKDPVLRAAMGEAAVARSEAFDIAELMKRVERVYAEVAA